MAEETDYKGNEQQRSDQQPTGGNVTDQLSDGHRNFYSQDLQDASDQVERNRGKPSPDELLHPGRRIIDRDDPSLVEPDKSTQPEHPEWHEPREST